MLIFPSTELVDLMLSQAIDKYRDMASADAIVTIINEWPPQIAALLVLLFAEPRPKECEAHIEFIQQKRVGNDTIYFIPIRCCPLAVEAWRNL